ncbi:MAG: TIGR02147 family protein, partial [Desulfobacterales bacterium]
GQRSLTHTSIAKIAKGFELKKQEREFFEYLVFMNQASTHDEQNLYYRKMLSIKGYTNTHRLEKASYDYFAKWYYPAIREIVTFGDHSFTPEQIADRLNPEITSKEAEKALRLLLQLALIEKDPDGRWRQCDKIVSTGPEVSSLAITNYHKEMLKLASESIERYPAEERDITAITVSVKRETLADIKARVASFRRELLELASSDENSDQIYQINFQVFPLTNRTEGGTTCPIISIRY